MQQCFTKEEAQELLTFLFDHFKVVIFVVALQLMPAEKLGEDIPQLKIFGHIGALPGLCKCGIFSLIWWQCQKKAFGACHNEHLKGTVD